MNEQVSDRWAPKRTIDPSVDQFRNDPYFLWFTDVCTECGHEYLQEYAPEGNLLPPGWLGDRIGGWLVCEECVMDRRE